VVRVLRSAKLLSAKLACLSDPVKALLLVETSLFTQKKMALSATIQGKFADLLVKVFTVQKLLSNKLLQISYSI
jgi:hypothetical protein